MVLRRRSQNTSSESVNKAEVVSFDELKAQLSSTEMLQRRSAARGLSGFPESIEILLSALANEHDYTVQQAILDSIEVLGGDEAVLGLIPFLRSEDAGLRNSVIETLQSMPESVAMKIGELLNDEDSDVRIFAVDVLQVLPHKDTPKWLSHVLETEQHVNVVATVVDRLAEVGTEEMIETLEGLKARFPDEPYLWFAIDTAITRIGSTTKGG